MTELENLVGSVKAWFNQPYEVNLRIQEQEDGLSEPERRIIRFLPQQSRILDIGCATGRASIALAKEGHIVTGIDVAEQLIAKARTAAEEQEIAIAYQVCNPVFLPFSDGVFDAALLLKTYCYVPKRQNRIAWLNEIARVLKPNGWLLLSQQVIDEALGSYEPIHQENQRRFPSISATLEEGDGFSLPAEGSETVAFIHYFMEADLRDELESSPFQIIDSFREDVIFYCTLKNKLCSELA
ncbi:class I SAM-dependent methyltransferase [Candidatus Poribacteria bacterium]|nr:class I SAM-dependent methyltransferase [Candidatus Poribacteria bacterium]